jgi:hypothetical protein
VSIPPSHVCLYPCLLPDPHLATRLSASLSRQHRIKFRVCLLPLHCVHCHTSFTSFCHRPIFLSSGHRGIATPSPPLPSVPITCVSILNIISTVCLSSSLALFPPSSVRYPTSILPCPSPFHFDPSTSLLVLYQLYILGWSSSSLHLPVGVWTGGGMLLQRPIFVCRHAIAALLRLLLLYLRTTSVVLPFLTLFRQSDFPFVSLYFPHLPPVTRVPSSLALPFSLRPVHIFACPLSTADMGMACLFLASSCWGLEGGGGGAVLSPTLSALHVTPHASCLCQALVSWGRRRRRRLLERRRIKSKPRRINLNTSYWFYFLLPDLHLPSPFVSKILCRLAASQLSSVQHLRNFPCSSTLHPVFINTSYWFSLFISDLPQPGQSFRGAAAGTFATCAHHLRNF